MELAIDTSTAVASLALAEQGLVKAELTWRSEMNHTVELLPNIVHMMTLAKVGPQALSAIIVARGPGSFNGVRVGVAMSKGLAVALNIPLVGIGTLEVMAFPHRHSGLPICPLLPAGREEVAVALFRQRRGRWLRLWEEQLLTPDGLFSRVEGKTLFCGEIPQPLMLLLEQSLGSRAVVEATQGIRRAGYLAELGWQRLQQQAVDNPASLQPIYLRRPPITMRKSR